MGDARWTWGRARLVTVMDEQAAALRRLADVDPLHVGGWGLTCLWCDYNPAADLHHPTCPWTAARALLGMET